MGVWVELPHKKVIRITPPEPGDFDRLRAYKAKHACTLIEAVRATGWRGTRIEGAEGMVPF